MRFRDKPWPKMLTRGPQRPRSVCRCRPSTAAFDSGGETFFALSTDVRSWLRPPRISTLDWLWTMRRSYLPTAQCASPEMGSIIMEALQPMSRHTFSSVKQSCILILSLIASARRFALERRARGICPAQVQPSAHVHTLGYCSFSQTIAGSIRVQMRSCDNDTCVRVRSCSYCKPSI
jgi:hypothetical protein